MNWRNEDLNKSGCFGGSIYHFSADSLQVFDSVLSEQFGDVYFDTSINSDLGWVLTPQFSTEGSNEQGMILPFYQDVDNFYRNIDDGRSDESAEWVDIDLSKEAGESYPVVFDQVYGKAFQCLLSWKTDDEGVEEGAVISAQAVLRQMYKEQWPPPKMSNHGGDAVVFLWSLGERVNAITVTEGAFGCLTRENRETVFYKEEIKFNVNDLNFKTIECLIQNS
ncbi:hypothetical protein [Acetobacter sp. AAB5]|uniref:hypothetical protein n=1 Tax=Acetobacter sp. AAB5 TaxID=3418370 RepID=UPI003CF01777